MPRGTPWRARCDGGGRASTPRAGDRILEPRQQERQVAVPEVLRPPVPLVRTVGLAVRDLRPVRSGSQRGDERTVGGEEGAVDDLREAERLGDLARAARGDV